MPNILDAIWYEYYLEVIIERYYDTKNVWKASTIIGKTVLVTYWASLIVCVILAILNMCTDKVPPYAEGIAGGIFGAAALLRWFGYRYGHFTKEKLLKKPPGGLFGMTT